MSTALSTPHRIADPLATAVAVLVIIAGAGVLGIALGQDEPTAPATPTPLTQGRDTSWNPGDTVGLGDFTAPDRAGRATPPRGGHPMPGQP